MIKYEIRLVFGIKYLSHFWKASHGLEWGTKLKFCLEIMGLAMSIYISV